MVTELKFFDVDHVPPGVAWAALVLSGPFWFLIYMYLDSVMPNEYGIQKHPCFCCRKTKSIEKGKNAFNEIIPNEVDCFKEKKGDDVFIYDENDPILIQNLTKKFGKTLAVNQLKLSIKKDEIFTILGHNGAGKTTAIYMLTGML